MSPGLSLAEWTGVLAGSAAVLTSFGTLYATNRVSRKATADANTSNWQGLNDAIARERDRLSAELKTADSDYRRKLREMESDYVQQLEACRAQVEALRQQLTDAD
jgi:hypothetical protein